MSQEAYDNVNEEIRKLEELIEDEGSQQHLSGFKPHCNRNLSINSYVQSLKTTLLNFQNNLEGTVQSTVKLDEQLTKAENKVEEVKAKFGLSSGKRRLIFNALSDVGKIYENIQKAREQAHSLIANYKTGEEKVD